MDVDVLGKRQLTSNGLRWIENVSGKLSICDGSSESDGEGVNVVTWAVLPEDNAGIKKWILRLTVGSW